MDPTQSLCTPEIIKTVCDEKKKNLQIWLSKTLAPILLTNEVLL